MSIHSIRGVLFDFDGVLVDSAPVHRASWQEAFRRVLGRQMPDYPADELTGASSHEIGERLANRTGTPERASELVEAKIAALLDVVASPEPLPGAIEVTASLHARGVPFGIASNAPGQYVRRVAAELGIQATAILGFEDVPRPKPAPDAYIACARAIGFSDDELGTLLVCEDSVPGIAAARAAGMPTLGITSMHNAETLLAAGADLVAGDLSAARSLIPLFAR